MNPQRLQTLMAWYRAYLEEDRENFSRFDTLLKMQEHKMRRYGKRT